jgi:hypothetical protein
LLKKNPIHHLSKLKFRNQKIRSHSGPDPETYLLGVKSFRQFLNLFTHDRMANFSRRVKKKAQSTQRILSVALKNLLLTLRDLMRPLRETIGYKNFLGFAKI